MRAFSLIWAILRLPWVLLRALARGFRGMLHSARFWILVLLAFIGALVVYYALADVNTPFTRDAYVQAYVIQVAPQVEGQVVQVHVRENQLVDRDAPLFEIDARPYEHRVRQLEAKVAQMTQQIAQMQSDLAAARAEEARISADEALALTIFEQESVIYKQASTTQRKYLDALQKHKAAQALVDKARAVVRQKEQALEAKVGNEYALVAEARAELATARLNLEWTRVAAPARGYITNLQLRVGSYVKVGQPVLTLIDADQWWIVANFRENNLEHLEPGQTAAIAFNSYPGRVFYGRVESVGWGVGQGQGVPSGELPIVKPGEEWVRPAQRFQVRVLLDDPDAVPLRVGATAAVTVYTRDDYVLNPIADFWQQVEAWFNYLR